MDNSSEPKLSGSRRDILFDIYRTAHRASLNRSLLSSFNAGMAQLASFSDQVLQEAIPKSVHVAEIIAAAQAIAGPRDSTAEPEVSAGVVESPGRRPAEPQEPWVPSPDSELAKYVHDTTEQHLHTYADPKRLREDVLHETGVLEAAYRRRQVVELVQNGADALLDSDGGRIEVLLDEHALYVANEGAPLSQDGLDSLLYFNMSGKKGKEIGRLGVGFKSVLELSSRPYLLSRSVSLSFNRDRTARLLADRLGTPIDRVPVMRFAETADPFVVAEEFPRLRRMLEWATTVAVLPLDQPKLEWLAGTLTGEEFRSEFLLFSPHVSSVTFEDRTSGTRRSIWLTRDGEELLVRDDTEAPTRWRVRTMTVRLDEGAIHDGGDRFERDELELAWALPLDDGQKAREIWAFFPVPGVSSSLPGILNTAWKLSEDRANLVQGEFNEFLLDSAAELVIDTITSHVPQGRPGLALELLPPAPATQRGSAEGTGWVSRFLQDAVWSRARDASIVPAVDASWHPASELRLWPNWVNKPGMGKLTDLWQDSVVDSAAWVHRSVMTDVRSQRARLLGSPTPPITTWLEAVCDPSHPIRSAKVALEIVGALRQQKAAAEDHAKALEARIVWTEDQSWETVAECRFDDDAPATTRPAHGLKGLVRELHRAAGIAEDLGERAIVALATRAATALRLNEKEAQDFWDAVHAVGPQRASTALQSVRSLSHIPVRTAAGGFKSSREVLLPDDIVDASDDPAFAVDLLFHGPDSAILSRIGVSSTPAMIPNPDNIWNNTRSTYLRHWENQWREMHSARGGSVPADGYGVAAPDPTRGEPHKVYPTHISILRAGSRSTRQRFSEFLMSTPCWDQRWVMRHDTVRSYEPLPIPSPTAHFVIAYGLIPTSLGPQAVSDTFGPAFADWSDMLPVAHIAPEATNALGLDGALEDVLEAKWSDELFAQIAGAADESHDGRAVRLLHTASQLHLAPPDDVELPPLTDRPTEAEELRQKGECVWICSAELLDSWPAGWEFPGIERPPAEPVGEVEILPLQEYFPALAARANAVGVQVWECDRVIVGSNDTDFGRRGDALVVSRSAERAAVLRWLADELLPQLSETEREALVAAHVDEEYRELAAAVSEEPNDPLRLVRLLGEEALRSACRALLPATGDTPAEQVAAQLLTLYGPATLKAVAHYLPSGLGVPHRWAGETRTLEFVQRLGFGIEFAGRRKAERPDSERVLGPTVAGELHEFQREIADRVLEILAGHGRGIVDLPTGAGKTRVAIESLLDHAERSGSLGTVLWIAEREELCEQAVVQWSQLWRARGLLERELSVLRYWGGRAPSPTDEDHDTVVVASRQQLMARLDGEPLRWLTRAQVVVIDEAHHSTARSYVRIIKWRNDANDAAFAVLGLSATPFRSDDVRSAHLARLFDRSLVTGQTMGRKWKKRIKWLQDREYLSHVEWTDLDRGLVDPTDREAALLTDQSNLTTGLDLLNERLGEDDSRNKQILSAIESMDADWQIVVFAGSVLHAQRLAVMLSEAGIPSRPVWGDLTLWARRHAIEEFRSQRIRVLTNYNVLSEGFDAPKTRAVVIARLVQSDGLFLQMLGRGMRGPNNGGTKKCLLVTTGERLPERFDPEGNLDIERHEYLWSTR